MTLLLLDFLFIITGLLFFALYYDLKKKFPSKVCALMVAIPVILLCMLFSYEITEGVYADLRRIPFFLASLYFGPLVSIILVAVIVVFRFILIGPELIHLVIFNYLLAFLVIVPISKRFSYYSLKWKLGIMIILCTYMSLFNLSFGELYDPKTKAEEYMLLLIVPVAASVIAILCAEMIRNLITLKRKEQKLEKLNMVGQLAASISHEVRNPLTSSKGFLQLIREEKDVELQRQFIELSLVGIEQATGVIEDYLTFTDAVPDEAILIDVRLAITEVANELESFSSERKIRVYLELEEGVFIRGQRRSFSQCMMNMMRNSIDSMPAGGKLTVKVEKKEKVLISICDTGVGMTKDQIRRFGEPFFTIKDESTGLGVMAAHIIVQAMKGNITVKSEPNKGTTIYIELNPGIA
ncbi:sensor histidine kinase [Rossellomorea marisflavi]|uniref:ATP-binding protein n=1 Tax=Rossellomorea marisflavi TaxID=189381 RepID=UPI00132FDCAF|nr:sensor histidine kinase [Rossellomorea marisflavi]MCM2605322.1 sensor histidine kinase [Rossellomorea marisflavi]